jgi:hypothetical protein
MAMASLLILIFAIVAQYNVLQGNLRMALGMLSGAAIFTGIALLGLFFERRSK